MRLRPLTGLSLGALALAGCSLLTDLGGLAEGTAANACDGGACSDAPNALDARGDGGDGAACVPTDVPDPTLLSDVVDLALGDGFTCALRANTTIACWGDDTAAMLGSPGGARTTPATVPGLTRITALTAGLKFACALDADQHAWCWGDNTSGQLGSLPPNPGSHPPAMVVGPDGQPLGKITAISAGGRHACALVDGAVWCWGANDFMQLGRASGGAPAPSATSLQNPVALAHGYDFSCAIADGPTPLAKALFCWGRNNDNELANTGGDTAVPQKIPVSLAAVGSIPVVTGGNGHACARDDKDELWCWGENDFGQLGPTVTAGPSAPVPQSLDALGLVRMAATGDDFTCAIAHDGTTRCLGVNAAAQLGNGSNDPAPPDGGSTPPHTMATIVTGLPPASRIVAGNAHACAILARSCPDVPGPVMCWGANSTGALGNGTLKPTRIPVSVLAP